MDKNVFLQKSRSGKLGSHKESEIFKFLGKDAILANFGLIFVIHFSRQEKIKLKKKLASSLGNLSSSKE